jgi:hypothetical protein
MGIACLRGAGDSIIRSEPYFAWRHIFRAIQADQGVAPGASGEYGAALVDAMISRQGDVDRVSGGPAAHERAQAVAQGVARALIARTRLAPQLLALDDAQWLDSASWGLLAAVVRSAPNILVMIASRSPADSRPVEMRALLDMPGAFHITLRPLDRAAISEIVKACLGSTEADPAIVDLVVARSQGNALFASEIALTLRDLELVKLEGERCVPAVRERDLLAAPLPRAVEGVISSRITRLSPVEQMLVKMASVIGSPFTVEALCGMGPDPLSVANATSALENVTAAELVTTRSGQPGVYEFRHALFAEVAYGLLSDAQRRDFHTIVAQWYEDRSPEDRARLTSDLAHHWSLSRTPARARPYFEQAATRAEAEFASEEAVALRRRALDLIDPGTPRAERALLELAMGSAYVGIARYAEGRIHLEAGLRLLRKPRLAGVIARSAVRSALDGPDPISLKRAMAGARQLSTLLGLALDVARWALRSWIGKEGAEGSRTPDLTATFQAHLRLTEVYYFANENLRSVRASLRALDAARSIGPSPELAEAYATVGPLLGFAGLPQMAAAYFDRAFKLARLDEGSAAATYVGLSAGYYHTGLGNWDVARKHLLDTQARARAAGDWRREADAAGNLMAILWLKGENAACKRMAGEILDQATRRENARYLVEAHQALANCYLDEQDLPAAQASISAATRLTGSDLGDTVEGLAVELEGLTCILHLRMGNRTEALERGMKLNLRARRSYANYYGALTGYSAPAAAGLRLWRDGHDVDRARRLAKSGISTMRKYVTTFRIGRPRLLLLQSVYEALQGRHNRAARLMERGVAEADLLGMAPERRFHATLMGP